MREPATVVFKEVLACLDDIARDKLPPVQASERIGALRRRHPRTSIELVWDEQAFDRSLHYDALIRPPDFEGTVSVSVSRDDSLPWPLRGLQPWRDSELLRVNGIVMPVEAAIRQLDMLWLRKPLMKRLIDSCLIEAEIQRRDLDVTPAEVQEAMNDMRRRRGLLTAADTQAWLAASGMSSQGLVEIAMKMARAARLRDVVVGDDVDEHLEQHRDAFDIVTSRELRSPRRDLVEAVATTMHSTGRSFIDAAQDAFVRDSAAQSQLGFRRDARHELAVRIGSRTVQPGDLFGPLEEEDEFALIEIVSVERLENAAKLRRLVAAKLFENWLREQRNSARIEWFWGPAERTSSTRDSIE